MATIRVLNAIPEFSHRSGGPVTGIVSLAPGLRAAGVETIVSSSTHDIFEALDVECVPRGRNVTRYQVNFTQALWLMCNVGQYDLVVLHGAWSFSTLVGWLAARRHKVPFVLFPHGMLADWFKDHYPVKHRFKRAIWRLYLRRIAGSARGVIFTADAEVESARRAFPDFIGRVVRLHYCAAPISIIDDVPPDTDARMLLYLGRLHEKKGVAELLEAVALIVAQDKWRAGTRLVVAGGGSSGYEEQLREILVAKGLTPYVELVGPKTGFERARLFQQAWFFVLPSWQENFGMVLAEAASAGVPSITTEGVDIHESIYVSGAGLIVKRPEPSLIANAIVVAIAMSDEERSEMSRSAREFYARHLSPAATVSSHSDFYRSVSGH
jgi:glycosyltransferase involved in cell wall biosynthesis